MMISDDVDDDDCDHDDDDHHNDHIDDHDADDDDDHDDVDHLNLRFRELPFLQKLLVWVYDKPHNHLFMNKDEYKTQNVVFWTLTNGFISIILKPHLFHLILEI